MRNYERYQRISAQEYDKKTIMSYLCRIPADKKIVPLISGIKDKSILSVGLGTGFYSGILMKTNTVVGVDLNPHLCRLPIRIHQGSATELSRLVDGEKFDIVFSAWMTEYLNEKQLEDFFSESTKVLRDNGELITTVISPYGLGFTYIFMARVARGIHKYNYSAKQITDKLSQTGFAEAEIIKLSAWLGFPWAYMVRAKKSLRKQQTAES